MSPTRAAAYFGGTCLLAAWLASAASTSFQSAPVPAEPVPTATSGTEALASDVQRQTARLRERLAAAPAPQTPSRNPFQFGIRQAPPDRSAPVRPAAALVPAPQPVDYGPPVRLIGIAENQTPEGPVWSALITGPADELFVLLPGQALLGRYRVTAVSSDAVEIRDDVTGAARRLALPH